MKNCIPCLVLLSLPACTLTAFSEFDLEGDTGGAFADELGLVDEEIDDTTTDPEPGDGGGSLANEDCNDGADNDGDNDVDCDDSDCDTTCDSDGDGEIALAFGGEDCDDNDRKVHTGAEEICGDGKDNDCSGVECEDFASDFEGGPGQGWVAGGDAGWILANGMGRSGSTAFRSTTIGHSEDSGASVTLDYASPGKLSFWHSGSTEEDWDELIFYVDGTETGRWSGVWGWTREVVDVSAGTHEFSWRYKKDNTTSFGQDAAMLDDVVATGGSL